MNHLIMFTGNECPHCDIMRPLLAKLEFETGISVEEREVWNNETNFRVMKNYQESILEKDPDCDGLPFFYNTNNNQYLCGEVTYKKLKDWAIISSS